MRSLFSSAFSPLASLFGPAKTSGRTETERHYEKLWRHYLNHGVYEDLRLAGETPDKNAVGLRSLRSPANRAVEFYAAKLAPEGWLDTPYRGEEEIEDGDALRLALAEIEKASNFPAEGRPTARGYAALGDQFFKAAHKEDADGNPTAVYRERLDPANVAEDFEKDERGFFLWLRVDTPKTRKSENGDAEAYTLTEVWDKREALYRRFEHDRGKQASLKDLAPFETERVALSAEAVPGTDGYTGYDFVPVVHAKFRDIGSERGLSCFAHALSDIAEADSLATRLHETLFPDDLWVLSREGFGPDGEALPAPEWANNTTDGQGWARGYEGHRPEDAGYARLGKRQVAKLPSGVKLEAKIPQRDLSPLVDALDRQVAWVERKVPETAYYKLRELELSGVAMRTALMDVYDSFSEAAGNLSAAIVRANEMCLTIAQGQGLDGFSAADIGTYENGGFDHRFESPDPFPETPTERAEREQADANALKAAKDLGPGPYRKALEARGWSEADARAEAEQANTDTAPGRAGSAIGRLLGRQ